MRSIRTLPLLCLLGLLGMAAVDGPGPLAPRTARAAISDAPVLALAGRYTTGLGDASAETVAYENGRMYVTNGLDNSLDVVDVSDLAAPVLLRRVDLAAYGAGPTSVDVDQGRVAVAVEADPKTDPGVVAFFDRDGNAIGSLTVGALPDMLAFTPDGKRLVVANEGEPSGYGEPGAVDPEGTMSIINLRPPGPAFLNSPGTVRTVDFRDFNAGKRRHGQLPEGIRLFGPGASVAQDIEPEYAAISADSRTAYVTLQENNAIAVIDLNSAKVKEIRALGLKDHSLPGMGLDASDRDDAINIANWPVYGMYMPDALSTVRIAGKEYVVTANEGDARDWPGLEEEVRVGSGSYVLDPAVFPNAAELKKNFNLGRLTVSRATGDIDGDGNYEEIHVFGARSIALWDAATGALVADTGDVMEQVVADVYPGNFNASHSNNDFDNRSDNKGPEPEGVATGIVDGVPYAFVGIERQGGVMMFDLSDPTAPTFVQYVNARDFDQDPPGPDSGAEIVRFVPAVESPSGLPLVLVGNEVSGTVSLFALEPSTEAATLSLLHNNDGESSLLPLSYATSAGTLSVGGAAAYKAVIDREVSQARAAGRSVLNVYAGDAFLASSTLACSLPPNPSTTPIYDAVAQRRMAYDAHILGNHEFDFGPDFLERFIRAFEANGRLDRPFLSGTLSFAAEPGFDDLIDADGIIVGSVSEGRVVAKALIVTEPTTGARFGIASATTPLLPTISSPRDVELLATDLVTTADVVQSQIDVLRNGYGLTKILFVSHLQDVANDRALIGLLSGVDIAVTGGGDELLAGAGVPLGQQLLPGETQAVAGTYPLTETDADGRTVYLVTTAGNYKYLGRLDVVFDAAGEVAGIDLATSYPRRVVPEGAVATALGLADTVEPDAGIEDAVAEPVQDCLDALGEPMAGTEVLLDVTRGTATTTGGMLTLSPGVRTTETNAGNSIADGFLAAYDTYGPAAGLPGRDPVTNPVVAVQNGGGIRQNAGNVLPVPPEGVPGIISRRNTLDVLSFLSNAVTVVDDIDAHDLKEILERAAAVPGGGQFLQVAALEVVYDYGFTAQEVSAPPSGEQAGTVVVPGERVRELVYTHGTATIADDIVLVAGGVVVPGTPTLRVVTNSFTAAGGDNFPTFRVHADREQLPATYEQAWVEYLLTFPTITIGSETVPTIPAADPRYAPGGEGRITVLIP